MAKVFNGTTWIDAVQSKDQDLTDIAGLSPTNNDVLQRKSGAWINRTPTQLKSDLSLIKTDVGLSNVDNTSDLNKPLSTLAKAYSDRQALWGNGTIRAIRPPKAYGIDTLHSSAPSVVHSKSGTIYMVYRQGTDHFVNRDGVFKLSSSTDLGKNWTNPVTIQDLTPSFDSQGQGISESLDGTTLRLVYFKATAALGAAGVFFKTSTNGGASWSSETRIDSNLPYAATTDVIVERPSDGALFLAYYGRSGSETFDSVWIAKSTNGGSSWTSTRLANGQTASLHFDEPVIALNGTTAVMTFRYGGIQSIGTMLSTNTMETWGAATERFAGTGKAHSFYVNSNTLACIYRELSTGNAVMRYSKDNGVTWYPSRLVDPTMYPGGWMLYASSTQIASGVHFVAFAQERGDPGASPGTSRIFFTCVGEAGSFTPLGTIPGDLVDSGTDLGDVLFSTRFEQTDGAVASPWSTVIMNGAATTSNVANGTLSPSTVNVFTIPRVYLAGSPDVEIEADIFTTSGTGSAAGIVFRMVDAGNFLVFVLEDANARLYKYASGAATLLTGTTLANQYNSWATFKVHARGNNIYCFYNGWQIVQSTLSAGDQTTYGSASYHGLKLFPNSGSATNHRCRRFVIRK